MTREIKFRYYDKSDKRTGHVRAIYWGENGEWLDEPDVEVMQYTGLKDKNGKEIYEGDIISTHPMLHKATVEYRYGEFGFDHLGIWNSIRGFNKNHAVIGNIYENPELLVN